jgi:hypothetical protein
MMAAEIVAQITSAGGRIGLGEAKVGARLLEILCPLVDVLRERRPRTGNGTRTACRVPAAGG